MYDDRSIHCMAPMHERDLHHRKSRNVAKYGISVLLTLFTVVAVAEETKQPNDTPAFGIVGFCDLPHYESEFQSGLAVALPDNNATGVTLGPIVLPPSGAITDVVVGLKMSHTWVGDLIVTVLYDETCDGPIDAEAVLLCRPRGSSSDTPAPCGMGTGVGCSADLVANNGLLWDDNSPTPIAEGNCMTPVPSGCYRPSTVGGSPLSVFNGMEKGGCWYLKVADRAAGDLGVIQEWSVHLMSNTCACPAPPPADEAAFKVGTPVFTAPDLFDVPLLVDTAEDATFTQMTIEYDSNCLAYVPTMSIVGDDVTNPGSPFVDDVLVGGTTRHVLLNIAGQYTGCDQEVFVLRFQLTGTPPCALSWDTTLGGPNSNCHLNYDIPPGDGKILPDDISFCDGLICDPDVTISGQVEYYSNGTPIIAGRPDAMSPPVTVEDCVDQMPTTTATSPNADYLLAFGAGPTNVTLCATRPRVVCGSNEDGVISGDDVIALQDSIAPPGVTDPKRRIAADVNRDGSVNATDVIGIKRWIARKVCDGTDACGQMTNNNCSGTWRFLFFTNNDPSVFQVDQGNLGAACDDQEVPIEGILVGDFDGSWPNIFNPKASSLVDLALEVRPRENGEVAVGLRADLDAGESLRHVIYSLTYDPTAFEYLGMQPGSGAPNWDGLDNPDVEGEAHGIAHIPPQAEALAQPGEVVVFRFRPRHQDARSTISFTRLKANDIDVHVPDIEITGSGEATTVTAPLPTRYSVASRPNPFNPRTRVTYSIPAGADRVPVELRIFDIAGRLVRTLERAERGPGQYAVDWDGKNDAGSSTGTGIYLLRIQAGEWSEVEKLTLVK